MHKTNQITSFWSHNAYMVNYIEHLCKYNVDCSNKIK